MVLTEVGPKFGIGSSTMANWLFCSTNVAPNPEVIDWLKSRVKADLMGLSSPTKMQLWEQERPNNRISARMRAAVLGIAQDDSPQPNVVGVGLALADALSQVLASARGQEIVAEVSGKFTPQTPDDLLVLIEQATTIKAEAEATAQEAAELIAVVGMVRDWVNNQSRLADALRRSNISRHNLWPLTKPSWNTSARLWRRIKYTRQTRPSGSPSQPRAIRSWRFAFPPLSQRATTWGQPGFSVRHGC